MAALPGEGGVTGAWKMQVARVNGGGAAIDRLLGKDGGGRVIRTAVGAGTSPSAGSCHAPA